MSTGGSPTQGLPQYAVSRLQHSVQPGGAQTSLYNHETWLLADSVGFDQVGVVVGVSVVHTGRIQVAGLKQAVELESLSQGVMMGWANAYLRLQEEAAMLGADGVLVVETNRRSFDAEEHEYMVRGVAVRFRPKPGALRTPRGAPFVCTAGLVHLHQFLRRGLAPVTVEYGVCVYHVPHRSLRQALGQTFQNTEVPQFTQAWYSAREIALTRLQATLEGQGADVINNISFTEDEGVHGEHTVEFRLRGGGWHRRADIAALVPEVDYRDWAVSQHGIYPTTPWPDRPGTTPA